ncbi:neogenin isoform X2 [Daktulosphaira vitifoliae]|uniref:neogenin isoform X2 n=1 Tax=Daktulosphaira vitifoliae TaxID=58002 RepID=UPI0021AA1365|nr:neogenin isoform X2 [Daktulosphaira vitifoliae]
MLRTNKKQVKWKLLFYCWIIALIANVQGSVRFITEPSDIITSAGKTVRLDCEAKFDSVVTHPQIRWRNPDGENFDFIGDTHRSVLSNGSLLIKNIFNNDEKEASEGFEAYQCVAFVDNIGSAVSRTATITLARLSPFEKQPINLKLSPGQTAYFSCVINSQPSPRIVWLKDHSPLIVDDSRMTIFPSGSLEIDDVHKGDAGSYRCNVTGLDRHRLSDPGVLIVEDNEDLLKRSKAPEFVAKPHSTIALEGSVITLDCAAVGNPRPQISWLKDGTTIDVSYLDSRFRIIGTGGLQIAQVNKKDDGNYVCRAENHEDSTDVSATLEVQSKPIFIRKPKDTMVLEKEDVTLECDVEGKPTPRIIWLKNGDRIKQDEYLQFVKGTNLKILGLMTMDTGMFQCLASNPAGNIQASAFLNVLHAAEKPKDSKINLPSAPRSLEVKSVSTRFATLTWTNPIKSNGDILTYTVFYQQEGSDRERMTNTSLTEITITNLLPDKHYLFRITAINEYGIGESSPRLKVLTKPEVNLPGPPLNVTVIPTSSSSIFVSWAKPEQGAETIKEYKLFYIEDYSTEEKFVITKHSDYEITNLKIFTKYKVWVVAYNQNGQGPSSLEVNVTTTSSSPSKPPQDVMVEAVSDTEISIKWVPPPKLSQNGVITGYKIRYRKRDKKSFGDTITTAGDRTSYQISNLDKNSVYQVRLWTLNTEGISPPTDWLTVETFESNLRENTVPDPPENFKVRAYSNSLVVTWSPPKEKAIMVRKYTLSWGKGIPDVYVEDLGPKTRQYEIKGLESNADYVLSLAASNEMGVSPIVYQMASTRDHNINTLETNNLIPPIGLKANVISPNAIEVSWTDNSLLDFDSNVNDERLYIIRYNAYAPGNEKYKYSNTTDLSCIINDLKPNTQYEFTVKLVKGQFESEWSMLVSNNTKEAKPASPPRDLTAIKIDDKPQMITLNWQPPKYSNGQIVAYIVLYSIDEKSPDSDWVSETIEGDLMSYTIKGLTPNTNYFFKIQSKNSVGYGPFSTTINIKTLSATNVHNSDGTSLKDGKSGINNTTILYILIACCLLLISCIGIGIVLLCCKQDRPINNRSKKGYIKGSTGKAIKAAQSPNLKPPDLWIHHDQMELKSIEKSSQGSLDTSSGCGQGSTNTYDGTDTRVTIHHVPHSTNSLDKSNYVSSYVGNSLMQPLLSEERMSTLKRSKPKPVVLPIDAFDSIYNDTMSTLSSHESRSPYPRSQYATTRAHVTVDLTAGAPENNYIVQATTIPEKYESIPVTSTSSIQQHTGSLNTSEKRQQGHPLKSFSVPAPPPQSAPSTPQQKHIVTVRPQGSSSPYKKPITYSTVNSSPTNTALLSGQKIWKPQINNSNSNDLGPEVESLSKIQTSYSTEELNQEMANLEGLMKDLSAITASEFQC